MVDYYDDDEVRAFGEPPTREARPTPRLLMAGLSCADHIWQVEHFPPQGSRTHARAYRTQGGGPAATAAVSAVRLGAHAELWAIHGDDANGQAVRRELEAYGVDCSQLRTLPEAISFVSAIIVDPQGERYIFPYRGEGLTDSAEGWDYGRLERVHCVLSDLRHPVMAEAVLTEARSRGVPTVGDVSNTRHWELAGLFDYLLVSEECAAEVLGHHDPDKALSAIRQREDQVVGITLGEQGFLYHDGNHARHIPALPVEVVDTTGAGDVFHGAYAFAVAQGQAPARAGLFASVTAALSCLGVGRSAIPSADDVEKLLEKRTLREMEELTWT